MKMANYNRRPSEVILHLLAISGLFMTVNGRLLKTLEDTVVLVNDSIRLSCQSDRPEEIQFFHFDKYIYAGGTLYVPYKGRFVMEKTENHTYTLVNGKAGPEDAGVYKCHDEEGRGELSAATLTVLKTRLLCESNMHANGYIGPNTCNIQQEKMTFSCSVSFNGTSPRLVWRASNDDSQPINSSVCDHQPNRVNCHLTLMSDPSYDGTYFTCQTAQTSGTQYNCSTEVIKVQYFSLDRELKPVEKIVDEAVECSVRSNLNPSFEWLSSEDNRETVASNTRQHVIEKHGLYWCNVSYSIRDVQCSSMAAVIYARKSVDRYFSSLAATQASTSTWVILAFLLLSIAIIVASFIYIKQTKKPVNKKKWQFVRKLQLTESKKCVYGIAILDDELFSISESDSKFEVYSIKESFSHIRSCPVEDLTNPKDIVSCRDKNCLFIKDYIKRNNEASASIFRVSPTGQVEENWEIDGDTGQISIAGMLNVLVPLWDGSKLIIFTGNGELVREIMISPNANITFLRQAILFDSRYFLLVHGDNDSKEKHRVCALDWEGNLVKTFGDKAGDSPSKVNLPSHLVIDEDNSVIVIDRINRRLLRLSLQLEFITKMHLKPSNTEDELSAPWRVCLYNKSGLLIVADNLFKGHVNQREGRIFVYSSEALESEGVTYAANADD